jgi:hypothetical protein
MLEASSRAGVLRQGECQDDGVARGHALSAVLATTTTLGALASDTRIRANTRVAGQHVEALTSTHTPRTRLGYKSSALGRVKMQLP